MPTPSELAFLRLLRKPGKYEVHVGEDGKLVKVQATYVFRLVDLLLEREGQTNV